MRLYQIAEYETAVSRDDWRPAYVWAYDPAGALEHYRQTGGTVTDRTTVVLISPVFHRLEPALALEHREVCRDRLIFLPVADELGFLWCPSCLRGPAGALDPVFWDQHGTRCEVCRDFYSHYPTDDDLED